MTKTRRLMLTLFMLITVSMAIQHTARSSDNSNQPTGTSPRILVRVLELSGTGPDGNSHQLYASQNGYTTTLDALGRIGSQVNGRGLKDGAYHTLHVRLHDSYQHVRQNGSKIPGSFSEQGKPTYLRVRGMIMVKNGRATAMRMLDHTSHNGYRHGSTEWDDD